MQIRALISLGRAEEAYPIYSSSIGALPELTDTEGFRAYARAEAQKAETAAQQRLASIRVDYIDSRPLNSAAQAKWKQHYPNLPQDFLSWLASGKRTGLKERIEDETYEYRLLTLRQSLDWHAEFMDWLDAEIRQAIRESGIEPTKMVPIMGATYVPDSFMLRCDGGPGEYGAVYQWNHEEDWDFTKIADRAEALLPWLQAQLEAGEPFH